MSIFSVCRLASSTQSSNSGELLALDAPVVGEPLTLYRTKSGTRVSTTIVERLLSLTDGAIFVQTRNTVYRLESLTHMPLPLPRTGNDW